MKVDLDPKANLISLAVVGFVGGVVLVFLALGWVLAQFPDPDNAPVDAEARPPEVILEQVRERDRVTLTSYGWVDRERGIVRLPISVAMQKLIEERGKK